MSVVQAVLRIGTSLVVIVTASTEMAAATAGSIAEGVYLCTTEQKAGIGRSHLENEEGPSAFVSEAVRVHFKIQVKREEQAAGEVLRVEEVPYSGPNRDMTEWQSDHSVLHDAYLGDETGFISSDGLGILRLIRGVAGSDQLEFYHSGFEYRGGEDMYLSVRYGRCRVSE